ncbi:MAG: CpaF family protein [Clostridia bacterium]|nr:CpaF family protein [Clostridia bacterium]
MSKRLATLHAKHFDEMSDDEHEKINNDLSKIISNSVDVLLKESSELIVEVNNGKKDRKELESKIAEITNSKQLNIHDRNSLIEGVLNYIFYYGKLQPLVEDEDITDIDFTAYNYGVIKRNGVKELIGKKYLFPSEFDFCKYSQTLILRNEGIINENYSHERVSDEKYRLRINVSIPPRNLKHTSLNIRKHRQNPYTLDVLKELKMINEEQKELLEKIINQKNRFIIAGKGASGKTTLLRAMLMNVNPLDTYLVAEKDTELYLDHSNFIQQRIKKENHGGLQITLGDLIKDGLTMSLDGYVVGEIVSDEAWYFINAGVTDHMVAGTVHANSSLDVPHRLLSLVETFNPGIKSETILNLIAKSLDYIIYLKDFKVEEIASVGEFDSKKDSIDISLLMKGDADGR